MWLVSCRRQGTLTQGPAPDAKCKLNISLFLTLPHLLDCLIFIRNSVSILFLLLMMGEWHKLGVVDSYQDVGGATGGGYYLITCFFLLVLLPFVPSCPFSFLSK